MGIVYLLSLVLLHLPGLLQVVSSGSSPLKCGRGSQACTDGSECVLYSHVCDGELDCGDGSDEENCTSDCAKDQFQCAHGKKCIDKEQVCDGEAQCQDRSDERHCTTASDGCVHQCDNKSRCLPVNFLCDGERDCLDGTDEASCEDLDEDDDDEVTVSVPTSPSSTALKCSLTSTPCKDNSECVLYSHICDGDVDCRDGSDEDDCASECPTGQFQCAHGRKCIEQSQVCDGLIHCQDQSDEQDCSQLIDGCSHQCDSRSRCVPKSFLCDGERDCKDGSDEANCAAKEACSTSEFKCTSGQCLAASMRCDGHPDCPDQSDEEKCTKPPVCTTKQRCPQSKECLVQAWVCDGDQDCKDGTDEKDCPVTQVSCGEFQWPCKSKTKCIPEFWRCDGMKDCDDGTDETECDMAHCSPHQFQCSSRECLDPDQVCNGVKDCADRSDEGGSCQVKCTDQDNRRCSQICFSTPQGARCGCVRGYRLQEDNVTCADINECEEQSVCSQLCKNSPGSYKCDCHQGYIIEADGQHCKITGEPFLLSSILNDLFLLGLRSGSVAVLPSSAKKAILCLDYDWRDQRVYWDSLNTESIKWSSLDQKTTGTLIKGVRADSLAVDWLGRNLYWIDAVNSQIFAIKLPSASVKSPDFTVILDEDLDQPRSLALLPPKGLMFWTEIGNVVKIERAGMDGSERKAVVTSSLGWPVGVTIDAISNRVYWTDQRLRAIGSATLDGEDIQILQMKETTNPFSLAVFNDILYWSDTKRRVVQAAHKLTGKNRHVLLKRPGQPFGVKIIHPLLQMSAEHPCETKGCSHLCVLAPGPKAVCKCPSGRLLSEDGLTCSSLVNSAFLLMLSPLAVTQIYLQSIHVSGLKDWPEHVARQLPGINQAAIMDYSLRDGALFVTDDGTNSLSYFNLKDGNLSSHSQLLKVLDNTITAMALDWVTLNIFWSSSKQQRLQVTSTTEAHTAVVLKEGIGRVESIALHPPRGQVCFTNLVVQDSDTVATVECSNLDGAERRVVWKDAVRPTSLVFTSNGDSIYWADTGLGTINSVQLDELKYLELKVGDGLAAVALNDDMLLWMTVGDKTRLWYRDEQQQNTLWFEVATRVVSLKVFSKSSQTGSNKCSLKNGYCQYLCLATPKGRTCKCAHDRVPVNATHCVPEQHCPIGSRLCLDQLSCQPIEKFCNEHVDCSDHSDENCVSVKQRSSDKVPGPSRLLSSPPVILSLPALSKNLNTTLNTSRELWTLDMEQCSETRCSSRGRCVEVNGEIACVCSLLYSGESCQDHLLKTLQEPLLYGAVVLVTLVAIVGLTVFFRRKKNNQSRDSPPAVKDTSLTEIKTKAETTPSAEAAPAETEKPEEVVSSADPSVI